MAFFALAELSPMYGMHRGEEHRSPCQAFGYRRQTALRTVPSADSEWEVLATEGAALHERFQPIHKRQLLTDTICIQTRSTDSPSTRQVSRRRQGPCLTFPALRTGGTQGRSPSILWSRARSTFHLARPPAAAAQPVAYRRSHCGPAGHLLTRTNNNRDIILQNSHKAPIPCEWRQPGGRRRAWIFGCELEATEHHR